MKTRRGHLNSRATSQARTYGAWVEDRTRHLVLQLRDGDLVGERAVDGATVRDLLQARALLFGQVAFQLDGALDVVDEVLRVARALRAVVARKKSGGPERSGPPTLFTLRDATD
jgi:hypothetical protein